MAPFLFLFVVVVVVFLNTTHILFRMGSVMMCKNYKIMQQKLAHDNDTDTTQKLYTTV